MLRKAWMKWKRITQTAGDFQGTIIFSILYFLLITPVGIIASFYNDFLKSKDFPKWLTSGIKVKTIKNLKKQY